MASSALSLLIKTPPKDLVHKTPSHHRLLVDVLQALATENLAKSTFVDDIDALYTLFDVCCDNGLGCYVIDYVTSVCLDPSVTSNDPLESFMSDGACIIKWAERCVGDLRRKLLSTPQLCRLATAPAGGSSTMLLALARLHTIASALGVLRQHGDGNAQEGGIQEEATLLMQLCTVNRDDVVDDGIQSRSMLYTVHFVQPMCHHRLHCGVAQIRFTSSAHWARMHQNRNGAP